MGLADFPSMLNRFFIWIKNKSIIKNGHQRCSIDVSVLYPEKGACADPVDEGAMLGKGGTKPP